jgi:hypothetical protein
MFKKLTKRPPLRSALETITRDDATGGGGLEEEDHDEKSLAVLSEVKERQKLRERPRGVDVEELNAGLKLAHAPEEAKPVDPFNTLTGGLVGE